MEKLINVLLEIIENVAVIIFILCIFFIILGIIVSVFRITILKICYFQEKRIINIFVKINIFFCIFLYRELILKLFGIEGASYIKKISEFWNCIYSNRLSKLIIYLLGILCIIIFLSYCIAIVKIIVEKVDSKYKISENKLKYTGVILLIVTGLIVLYHINKDCSTFLKDYLYLYIIFNFIKYSIIIFIILFVIFIFSIIVKVIIEYEKDGKELSEIKDNFSEIISKGANTASISKLCKNLGSISDEDIYKVLKSFKTPSLLGLKNILQQDKKRKKYKIPKILTSTTIFSGIGTGIKFLKDELKLDFIEIIDSQKYYITFFISMIILLIFLILLDPYLSPNKGRRIISSDYLLLLIDDILEVKKSEEILSVVIIEKRDGRVRRQIKGRRKSKKHQ